MSKVTVLGGSGAVGSIASETLAGSGVFSEITVADINIAAARKEAGKLKGSKVSAVEFDADGPQSLRKAISGITDELNHRGRFSSHRHGQLSRRG